VRRDGIADVLKWPGGNLGSMPYPYVSGPYKTKRLAEAEASKQRDLYMAEISRLRYL
jgi:hypothetical protein